MQSATEDGVRKTTVNNDKNCCTSGATTTTGSEDDDDKRLRDRLGKLTIGGDSGEMSASVVTKHR